MFSGSPIFTQNTTRPPPAYKTHPYRTTEHPSLSDHSSSRRGLFKAHCRITSLHLTIWSKNFHYVEYIGSQTRRCFPVEVQVAIVLRQFIYSMYGFRIIKKKPGITAGLYNNLPIVLLRQ